MAIQSSPVTLASIDLDVRSPVPLYRQLYSSFRVAISIGHHTATRQVYVTPMYQYPYGETMSLLRRLAPMRMNQPGRRLGTAG